MTAERPGRLPPGSARRLAGAPISWGICEVPGWGHQLSAGRVLAEMRALGLAATEFGPDGYLPADPGARARLLAGHGLTAAGGFVPVVLHEPAVDPLAEVDRALDAFGADGPERPVLVLAAATGRDGYEARPELNAGGWASLLANLDRVAAHAAGRGFAAVLHPHVGTMVETRSDVARVLDGSGIPLCLDTGHLLIGGTDPAELAAGAAERIGHVHLKDVAESMASRVRAGELGYSQAVRDGLYQPLGQGDVDVAGVVSALDAAGYHGWYVLEQDTILQEPPAGEGPVAQVAQSLSYLRSLA
ncbi:MAG TPA: TIM barrel protein [Trebonia sp.]|nr:TIM barrel protein [Trebonia sp.]